MTPPLKFPGLFRALLLSALAWTLLVGLAGRANAQGKFLEQLKPVITDPNLRTLRLSVSVSAPAGQELESIHVWDNDVPVFGRAGFKIPFAAGARRDRWSGPLQAFDLVRGDNKLEVSVRNTRGVYSLRTPPRYTNLQLPAGPKPNLYVVAVGVSIYQQTRYNLRYADSDAKSFIDILTNSPEAKKRYNIVANTNLCLLQNENATRGKINALKTLLQTSKPDDTVILFLSGHGFLRKGDFYFGTHDVSAADPAAAGLSYTDILNLLDRIPSRYRLVFIDACHSGPVDIAHPVVTVAAASEASVVRDTPPPASSDDFKWVSAKDMPFTAEERDAYPKDDAFTLMLQLFADLDRGEGAQCIAAASSRDLAYEYGSFGMGTFTKAITEALKDPIAAKVRTGATAPTPDLTVEQLRAYVQLRVKELTKGEQIPVDRQENLEGNHWQIF